MGVKGAGKKRLPWDTAAGENSRRKRKKMGLTPMLGGRIKKSARRKWGRPVEGAETRHKRWWEAASSEALGSAHKEPLSRSLTRFDQVFLELEQTCTSYKTQILIQLVWAVAGDSSASLTGAQEILELLVCRPHSEQHGSNTGGCFCFALFYQNKE